MEENGVEEMALTEVAKNLIPADFAKKYKAMKKLQSEIEKIENQVKDGLIEMFGSITDAPSSVTIDGLKFTYVRPSTKKTFDSKKFQEDHPEMYDKYIRESAVKASIRTSVEY